MPLARRLAAIARSPSFAAVTTGLLILAALLGLRGAGALQSLELAVYDRNLRTANLATEPDPRILIVLIDEEDYNEYGYPISDGLLALLVDELGRAGPRVIGLDLYRNIPIGTGKQRLARALREDPRVIGVEFTDTNIHIPGPKGLSEDRIGFNTLPLDVDQRVRRGLLYENYDDGEIKPSFGLILALAYLAADGILPEPDPEVPEWMKLGPVTIRPFEATDGGYMEADAAGYQFQIDCHHGRSDFQTVPFRSVFSGDADPEIFADRIVLIGGSSESVRDFQEVPCGVDSGTLTPGVKIHAHIVSQLLRFALGESEPLGTLEDWQEVALIALVVALGCSLALALRRALFFVAGLLVGAALLYLAGAVAFRAQLWIPIVAPGLGYVSAMGIVLAWTTTLERAQRALLMQLFSSYVSPEVADEIWRERDELLPGGRLRAQRLVATVLFVDMKGYTALAEKMEPEELMDWVNEFMEPMAKKVGEFHGVVDDYFGDGLKSNFGVPFPRETEGEVAEDARRAVRCALEMEQVLHRLNAEHRARKLPTIAMRVGIHTGPVVAGVLGSENRFKYTTVGDVAVTAQRLESFDEVEHDFVSQPCRILVSGETASRLDESFDIHPLGQFALRGKHASTAIHRVTGSSTS